MSVCKFLLLQECIAALTKIGSCVAKLGKICFLGKTRFYQPRRREVKGPANKLCRGY